MCYSQFALIAFTLQGLVIPFAIKSSHLKLSVTELTILQMTTLQQSPTAATTVRDALFKPITNFE